MSANEKIQIIHLINVIRIKPEAITGGFLSEALQATKTKCSAPTIKNGALRTIIELYGPKKRRNKEWKSKNEMPPVYQYCLMDGRSRR